MSRDPKVLEEQLRTAKDLTESLAKTSRIRDLTRWIDAADLTDLRIEAHLALAEALREYSGTWYPDTHREYFAQVARCIALCRAHRARFSDWQSRRLWFLCRKVAIKFLDSNPTLISAAQARQLLDDMTDLLPPKQEHEFHQLRMRLELRAGDMEAALKCERQARAAASFDIDRDYSAVVIGIMWAGEARHEDAVRTLSAYARGEGIDDFSLDWADPNAALGLLTQAHLHQGRPDEARRAHLADTDRDRIRSWSLPDHLLFCAQTGNIERGLALMHRHVHQLCTWYVGVLETRLHGAVAALLRRVVESGRGAEVFHLPKDDTEHDPLKECGGGKDWTYEEYFRLNLNHAMHFARRVDNVYGTTVHARNVHRIAHAEPVGHIELPEGRWHREPPETGAIEGDPREALRAAKALKGTSERAAALWKLKRAGEHGPTGIELEVLLHLIHTLMEPSASAAGATQLVALSEEAVEVVLTDGGGFASRCAGALLVTATRLIDRMGAYVPLDRMRSLLDAIGRLPEGGGIDALAPRFRVESNANQVDRFAQLWERAGRAYRSHREFGSLAITAGRAFAELEQDEAALQLLEPRIGFGGCRADDLLLPYLRTGRAERAEAVHEATHAESEMTDSRLAGHLLYCMETDRIGRARLLLHRHIRLFRDAPGNPGAVRSHAVSVRLARLLVEAGLGDTKWAWGTDEDWTYGRYIEVIGADAWRRAGWMELCYGSDHLTPILREFTGPHPLDLPDSDPPGPHEPQDRVSSPA